MPTAEEFLSDYSPSVQTMALKVRELIQEIMPDTVEVVETGHKVITYSLGEKMAEMVCYISAHKDSVNLGFGRGALLPDPDNLLGGTGKMMRHIKFKKLEQIDNPDVRKLLETALADHIKG